jgi:signal transducing adaptor molecule
MQPVYGYGPQPGPGGPQGYGWPQGPQQGGPPPNQPQQGYPGYPNTPGQPAGQQAPYAQAYGAQQPGAPYGQYGPGGPQQANTPTPYPQQAQPPVQPSGTPNQALQQHQQQQPQFSPQLQAQGQVQQQPQSQAPVQPHPQAQAQTQQSGPPYVYDPAGTYPDENATAWARYYAQGGTDPTGAAYFISVPGIKEGPGGPAAAAQPTGGQQSQPEPNTATGTFQTQPSHTTNPMPQRQDTTGSIASSTNSDATVTGYQPEPHHSPIQTGFPGSAPVGPTSPGLNAGQAMGYMDPHAQGQLPAPMPSAAPGPYGVGGAAAAVYPAGYPTPGGSQPGQPDASPQGAPWQGQYQGLPNAMGAMSLGGAPGPGSLHEPQPYAPPP